MAQQEEFEKQKRNLEKEKEEFKRLTEAAMVTKMRQIEPQAEHLVMSCRIQQLETQVDQMSTMTQATTKTLPPRRKPKPRLPTPPPTMAQPLLVSEGTVSNANQDLGANMKQMSSPIPEIKKETSSRAKANPRSPTEPGPVTMEVSMSNLIRELQTKMKERNSTTLPQPRKKPQAPLPPTVAIEANMLKRNQETRGTVTTIISKITEQSRPKPLAPPPPPPKRSTSLAMKATRSTKRPTGVSNLMASSKK